MKKGYIALIGLLAILVVVMAGCITSSLTGSMMTKNLTNGHWRITANTLGGHVSQTIDASAEDLAALYVKNANSSGTVSLVLTQDDTSKTYDVSGSFDGSIDTSMFIPGKVTIRLNIIGARNIDVTVKWK